VRQCVDYRTDYYSAMLAGYFFSSWWRIAKKGTVRPEPKKMMK
jgi:hypothetical protein